MTTKDGKRHTRWCFTVPNYTDEEYASITNWKMVRYLIIGREKCPTTGTPHLQGYVEWTRERLFSTIKRLNGTIHWEPAVASCEDNIKYCCKEDKKPFEKGEPGEQGKRNDLIECKQLLDKGYSELEIANKHFNTWANNYKAFERYKQLLYKDRKDKPEVFWIWGKAGVGKTKYVHDIHQEIYIKDSTCWWNGYEQQPVILIDDFDHTKWSFREFLRVIDRYSFQGQVKGNYVKINSKFIYITCEHPPCGIWGGNELDQVERRIDQILEISKNGEVSGNTGTDTSKETDILG